MVPSWIAWGSKGTSFAVGGRVVERVTVVSNVKELIWNLTTLVRCCSQLSQSNPSQQAGVKRYIISTN